ncbi:FAD dependent oxidoreductase [Candidatus Sulfotelmatomonas gaucii]|uniref:FAD dependent oxidoreductase n=1 Tax=Candidatus Sulfuritelmatomonas gaucii TaxID=2043161 RepID=A0A2N9L6Z4_9BACT|nr:FAD dependent oxidoreductase [Candidatus Sulfotelmatomonas gaucii]
MEYPINAVRPNVSDLKKEIQVRTSSLNQIPIPNEVFVIGGGVAGCAASIALARRGRSVTLIEREPTPRHKVCGEFLSGEALEDLHALGVDVASLGAVPIDHVRLAAARRAAEAPLPFPAASLTRKALDTALITEAIAAGVHVRRGRGVQTLVRTTSNVWRVTLDDGTTCEAPTAFLATGKHDLRGYSRPEDPERWVGFKMYFRLARTQSSELARASELMLYPGGYGGIQPVEDGNANLCWVIQQRYLARVGHRWENLLAKMKQDCPHLAMRLDGAEPLLAKPIAITHIPYGFIRRTTEEGLYCIGDQAAVIPSFTGDGISIALHTARCAVAAYLAAEAAPLFQARLRSGLLAQMRLAEFAADGLNNALARAVLPFCLRVWPGVMRVTAKLTRVAQHASVAAQAAAS